MHTHRALIPAKIAADLAALVASYLLGFWLASLATNLGRGVEYLSFHSTYAVNHGIIFGAFALVICFIFYSQGQYTQRQPFWHQVQQIILFCCIAMLAQGFLHYVMKYPLSRLWVGFSWTIAAPLIILARLFLRQILRKFGMWSISTVIIGDPKNALETTYALHSDSYADFDLRQIILLSGDIDRATLPKRYRNVEIRTGTAAVEKILSQRLKAYLVIAPDDSNTPQITQLIETCREQNRPFGVVPPMSSFTVYDSPTHYFFGHNVVMFQPTPAGTNPLNRLLKRSLDVTGAALGLLALSPLFITVAILIRKQAPGSKAFFKHQRMGQNGKPFYVYKFTSMVPNAEKVLEDLLARSPKARAEWKKDFKLKDDPRVTRIGAFLRKSSLDELPQLLNVLKGDMSLVGPRPIVAAETAYYGKNLRYYYLSKPGITGLWQISGRNDTTYDYRVYLDTWYAHHWSFWHDIVILFETVKIVLNRSGAY